MCPPHHFEVRYSFNPWMDPGAWANQASSLASAAEVQWQTLYEALVMRGATIDLIRAICCPISSSTANAAVVLDGNALLARFRHPERRAEEPVFAKALHQLKSQAALKVLADLPRGVRLEGAGDCLWDAQRRQFWLGFGFRSDRASREAVADFFGFDCVALELAEARFYHLDTAFCPLPFGEVMYYPGAFTDAARRAIDERVPRAQQIILNEQMQRCLRRIRSSFGRQILLSSCSEELRRDLEERGYRVTVTPLHAFLRSGGSACCLTLRINHLTECCAYPQPLAQHH